MTRLGGFGGTKHKHTKFRLVVHNVRVKSSEGNDDSVPCESQIHPLQVHCDHTQWDNQLGARLGARFSTHSSPHALKVSQGRNFLPKICHSAAQCHVFQHQRGSTGSQNIEIVSPSMGNREFKITICK